MFFIYYFDNYFKYFAMSAETANKEKLIIKWNETFGELCMQNVKDNIDLLSTIIDFLYT